MWGLIPLGGAVMVIISWALWLMLIDERYRRLPNQLTIPAAVGAGAGALMSDPVLVLGGLAWAGLYLLLGLVSGGIGGGDIKLALSLGIVVAAAGGVAGWFLAVLGSSVFTMLRALAARKPDAPHGPSMITATACSALVILA